MPSLSDWTIPSKVQPKPEDYAFDLDAALAAVVGIRTSVPEDAFTADTLGTERAGNGVLIRSDGLIVTIGYLVTEADQVWITLSDGRLVPGHVLAYDQVTGFGLVQALARLEVPVLPLGQSSDVRVGDAVVIGGHGGRQRSVAGRIVSKQEFAGYWEYLLDEAIFTGPAHPHWGGTAVIDSAGRLIGIGSLQLQQAAQNDHLNMIVPIDLLKPLLDDLILLRRRKDPPRPWLGLYATELDDNVVIAGVASGGPAEEAALQTGDLVLSVAGYEVTDLASLFRRIWSLGQAGAVVPMRIHRSGRTFEVSITSRDRNALLKRPSVH
jgi:S1-C subfamily serine protease